MMILGKLPVFGGFLGILARTSVYWYSHLSALPSFGVSFLSRIFATLWMLESRCFFLFPRFLGAK